MDQERTPTNGAEKWWQPWLAPVVIIAVSILISIFFLILAAILNWDRGGVLRRMSDIQFARGLITYLFAIVTIGTAVVLIVHVLTRKGASDDHRFEQGKEVLSLLLGIFGTIVGFYFGREVTTPSEETLTIAPLHLSSASAVSGGKVNVSTVAMGGKAPLSFAIVFGSETANPVEPVDTGGWIIKDVAVPVQPSQASLTVRVVVRDADNHLEQQTAPIVALPPTGQPAAK